MAKKTTGQLIVAAMLLLASAVFSEEIIVWLHKIHGDAFFIDVSPSSSRTATTLVL